MALQKKTKIPPEIMDEITRLIDERVRAVYVTREDFNELKEVVRQLGENMVALVQAQRRTEESLESFKRAMEESLRQVWNAINGLTERLNQLTIRVDNLAEAQKRTEERLNELAQRVDQLAEAQRRTEERLEMFERETAENFSRVWSAIEQLTVRVDELAEAQRRTEERLNQLAQRVDELAEAQRRTEERLNQLAEAQRKTEERLNELEKRMEDGFAKVWDAIARLTEAQRKTEERLNELEKRMEDGFAKVWDAIARLTEAQRKTEERLNELEKRMEDGFAKVWDAIARLTEAQRKTEERLNELILEHQRTREILMGISDTVGYGLEDKIMPYMYDFARSEFGVEAEIVERRNIVYPDGRYDEVNIYIEGMRDGKKVYVIGECKSRPSKKEVKDLMSVRDRLSKFLNADVYAFIVGYTFSPEVEDFVRETYPDLKMVKSYEFNLKYERRS